MQSMMSLRQGVAKVPRVAAQLRSSNPVVTYIATRHLGFFSGSRDTSDMSSQQITSFVQKRTEDILREEILPLNDKLLGPLQRGSDKRTPLPFIFLLGNHSSGKSTFINTVLGQAVQEAGVAPTDDGFTVIAPGPRNIDQDGPSLIGDPDMGFSSLRSYGPALIHHVNLKVRTDLALQDVMLVDSPGMIDSPTDSISYVGAGKGRNDRGYDFEGAARWFAERADVILLFFDPDKPGTTGETLSVLTNALSGMDHKLHIVLNKVDRFEKIHDFARAYGSLCWNLSKVIPRKDLPRIYTMCAPVQELQHENSKAPLWATALEDLEATRQEVVAEVKRAPERRIDNMITQLDDSARLLSVHATLLESIRTTYQELRWKILSLTAGVGIAGNTFALGALQVFPSVWSFSATLAVSSLTASAGIYLYGAKQLELKCAETMQDEQLDAIFHRLYARQLAENDEYVQAMWNRVKPHLKGALHTGGIPNLKRVSSRELEYLSEIVEDVVPELRRVAAPLQQRIGTNEFRTLNFQHDSKKDLSEEESDVKEQKLG